MNHQDKNFRIHRTVLYSDVFIHGVRKREKNDVRQNFGQVKLDLPPLRCRGDNADYVMTDHKRCYETTTRLQDRP